MSPVAGTPAGTVVVGAAGLRAHGGTVTAGDAPPAAGELAVFCRPVVTAPAVVRRDGACWRMERYRQYWDASFDRLDAHLRRVRQEPDHDAAPTAR